MQQKLLRQAGWLAVAMLTTGIMLTGCIDEPNPPVLDRITSEIRFVLAIPGAPAVDVYVDEVPVASSVSYKGFSNYLEIKSGNRFLRLVPAGGDTSTAIFRRQVSVRSFTKITMAFFGTMAELDLLATQERFTYADETSKLLDSCDVKLVNVNLGGEAIKFARKVNDTDAQDLIPAVNQKSLSSYKRVLCESNDFYLVIGNSRVVTFAFDLKKPGYRYTFLFIGDATSREVLTLQDEPYQK